MQEISFHYSHDDGYQTIRAFYAIDERKDICGNIGEVWRSKERVTSKPLNKDEVKTYEIRVKILERLKHATLSIQCCLLDPRGPQIALQELASEFERQIREE